MTIRRVSIVLLLAWAACVAGCSHYVNIPPQRGDFAFHDPNSRAARSVMLVALQKAMEDRPMEGPFQVILPVGTMKDTYARILPQLGVQAMWASDGRTRDMPIVKIDQVLIRGTHAEIDVIRPVLADDGSAGRELVTVSLLYDPVSKWYATRLKEWRRETE